MAESNVLPTVGASSLAPGAAYSATGLDLPDGMSFEQWSEVGGAIQRIARSWQWWFGDWHNYGETRYGEKYAQAIESTGLDTQTLMNIAWVCRKVEISRRREILPFAHHIEGWGDYILYGFESQSGESLAAWMLGDLKVFRLWFNRRLASNGGRTPGALQPNHDRSSQFRAFRITDLPDDFLIARKANKAAA